MSTIHFQLSDSLQAWCLGLSLLSWAFLFFLAVRRKNRARLIPRVLLLSIAILSISLALLQPAYWIPKTPKIAILKTPQAKSSQIDSLLQSFPGASVIHFNSSSDLTLLLEEQPEIQELHIVGDGIPKEELKKLQGKSAWFYLNESQEGIIDIKYTRKARVGKQFQLAGTYYSNQEAQQIVWLDSPTGRKKILSIDSVGFHFFESEILVKKAGHFLFNLVLEDADGTVLKETPLPVQVIEDQKLKVLILNHAPNFETKYLKNWLADQGYAVVVRSSISKEKFKTEFLNTSVKTLGTLNQQLLNQFDLLILQAESIEYFNANEQNQINEAVKNGLGLCFLVNQHPDKWNFPRFKRNLVNFPFKVASNNFTLGEKEEAIDLPKVPISIKDQPEIHPILRGENNQIIAAYQLKSGGKVSIFLLPETYLLPLAGKTDLYENLWSPIFEKTARTPYHSVEWTIEEELLSYVDYPLGLQLYYDGQSPIGQIQTPDSTLFSIHFKQNPFLSTQWESQFWPASSGWHEIFLKGEPQASEKIYIPEPNHWRALKQRTQVKHNRIWSIKNPPENRIKAVVEREVQSIPLWWFYLLFLVAAGALWLEEKL